MPYTIPARVNRQGSVVPEIIVDDEFADIVQTKRWCVGSGGYAVHVASGNRMLMHRFLWALKHGSCPQGLDHINRNKLDNRLANLRPANQSLNNHNKTMPVRSLPTGVSVDKRLKLRPYMAYVNCRGRFKNLGYYATPEEAHAVHVAMKFMLILVESALCA